MKKIILIISIVSFAGTMSCELSDFDLQDNPSELTPKSVNPHYLLNEIQILFGKYMRDMSLNTDPIMRYENMKSSYQDIAKPGELDNEWEKLYALYKNARLLEKIAENDSKLLFHTGMSKVLTAYAFATMVDFVGDIPYSEANNPDKYPNPKVESGKAIYDKLLLKIDEAISDLGKAKQKPLNDLFYDKNAKNWIKLANTLKLRMLLHTRLVNPEGAKTEINKLLKENNMIASANEDFQFNFSEAITPDSRHPYFKKGYLTEGFTEYIGNYFMWLLKDSKPIKDPRLRYYVYRQTNRHPLPSDLDMLRCTKPEYDYCYIGDYYWGRDHGDDETRPADRKLKSTYGIYPGGGAFDADNFVPAAENTNSKKGAGIFPILLSSYTDFMKAELALTLGTTGDPEKLLETAIKSSMDKVLKFATVDAKFKPTATEINNYVNEVLNEYKGKPAKKDQLDIVIREYYLATYGNSIESYNAYRRTGYPSNIQEPVKFKSIPFPRSYPYAEDAVNANTSLEGNKPITDKVFWDNNPDGFIK